MTPKEPDINKANTNNTLMQGHGKPAYTSISIYQAVCRVPLCRYRYNYIYIFTIG